MINEYKQLESIGRGSYGIVSLLTDNRGHKIIAKKMNNKYRLLENDAIKEIFILSNIIHPNIIKAIQINSDKIFKISDTFTEIFLEYMDGDLSKLFNKLYKYLKIPSLRLKDFNNETIYTKTIIYEFNLPECEFNYLVKDIDNTYYFSSNGLNEKPDEKIDFYLPKKLQKYLDWNLLNSIMKQIIDGIICLHNNGIVHSDLKPHNILYKTTESENGLENLEIKLTDFGISELMIYPKYFKKCYSTPHYNPPECNTTDKTINDIGLSYKMDSYSIGSTFYTILIAFLKGYTNASSYKIPNILKNTKEEIYKEDGEQLTENEHIINSILVNNNLFLEELREQVSKYESLIRKMLKFNLEERITCLEARNIIDHISSETIMIGGVIKHDTYSFENNYYNLSKETWIQDDYNISQFTTLLEREYYLINNNLNTNQLYSEYISFNPESGYINHKMINILMDWISHLIDKKKKIMLRQNIINSDEIFAQTILILQFYINIKGPNVIPKEQLQAYGIVAFNIAAIIYSNDFDWAQLQNFYTTNLVDLNEIYNIQRDILNTIGCIPVILNYYWVYYYYTEFIYNYLKLNELDMDLYNNEIKILSSYYLLEMKLFVFPKYLIGLIVTSIVLLVNMPQHIEILKQFLIDKINYLLRYNIPNRDIYDVVYNMSLIGYISPQQTNTNIIRRNYPNFNYKYSYNVLKKQIAWIQNLIFFNFNLPKLYPPVSSSFIPEQLTELYQQFLKGNIFALY